MQNQSFESIVNKYIKNNVSGSVKELTFDITSKNQHFALIININFWYAVRLVLQLENRLGNAIFIDKISEHWTLSGAKDQCNTIIKDLKNDDVRYPKTYNTSFDRDIAKLFSVKLKLTNDQLKNYSNFLIPGDHIKINRKNTYYHDAIYLGNNQVIQVTNKKDPIEKCSFSKFLGSNQSDVYVCLYIFKSMESYEIVRKAMSFIGTREGEYNILRKNCQSFALLCSTSTKDDISSDLNASPISGVSPLPFGIIFYEKDDGSLSYTGYLRIEN